MSRVYTARVRLEKCTVTVQETKDSLRDSAQWLLMSAQSSAPLNPSVPYCRYVLVRCFAPQPHDAERRWSFGHVRCRFSSMVRVEMLNIYSIYIIICIYIYIYFKC